MDFLLILIREFLATDTDTKLILMSATMNSQHFASYFKKYKFTVPIINVPARRKFSIEKKFLDQLGMTTSTKIINYDNPTISEEMMQLAGSVFYPLTLGFNTPKRFDQG